MDNEIEKNEEVAQREGASHKERTATNGEFNQAYQGFGIVSFIFGLFCVFLVGLIPLLCLLLGIVGTVIGLISISKKWSTIGITAIAVNMTGLAVVIFYFFLAIITTPYSCVMF